MGLLDWWEDFFCPRYRFRSFEILETATPNLRRRAKRIHQDVMGSPPWTCDKLNDIPVLNVDSDGRYLLMQSTNDWHTQIIRAFILSWIPILIGSLMFLIDFLFNHKIDEFSIDLIVYALPFYFSLLFIRRIVPANSVIIFDRKSGNVYFPSKLFHRAIVVPIEDIDAWRFYYVYKTGMAKPFLYLSPLHTPRFEFWRFDRVYISGREAPGFDAPLEILWCNVLRFMDKSKPLPHFESLSSHIQWYKEHNTTIPERYANYAKLRMPHA